MDFFVQHTSDLILSEIIVTYLRIFHKAQQ